MFMFTVSGQVGAETFETCVESSVSMRLMNWIYNLKESRENMLEDNIDMIINHKYDVDTTVTFEFIKDSQMRVN